jgi:UDP-N-acetylmuramate dehydrogenase
MPEVRGKLRANSVLAKSNWFRVGGAADWLFRPEDIDDLTSFMQQKPRTMPHMVLGVGSNVIVRDGGVEGVVIRLGRAFTTMQSTLQEDGSIFVEVGAGALGRNLAVWCQGEAIAGLEFLSGIPGTVGGAVAMNAGAYGAEVKDRLIDCTIVTAEGMRATLTAQDLQMRYRHASLPDGVIICSARFRCERGDAKAIAERIEEIQASREATQPIRERTGGSTFKNPSGAKAWELVDAAGGRGLRVGGAQMSEKHCNFMINTGDASAEDLEQLGEVIRKRVQKQSGVMLEWEIRRVGKK